MSAKGFTNHLITKSSMNRRKHSDSLQNSRLKFKEKYKDPVEIIN